MPEEAVVEEEVIEDEENVEQAADEEIEGASEEESGAGSEEVPTGDEEEGDTVIISIGGEEPEEQEKAPDWVRELRKKNREDQRRIKELEAKLEQKDVPNKVVLGKKPILEDFDYDAEQFEAALESWFDRKRAADKEVAKAESEKKEQEEAWQAKLDDYDKSKATLKVDDYEDAEISVQDTFDVTQQGIMIQGAENPGHVVYALGKNDKKARELAAIKDPVKFAFAIAKLETQLKVSERKKPPAPEKKITGTGSSSGSVDSTLERLRADAEKTGDYSEVAEYKRKNRKT